MKVLLDVCTPVQVRQALPGHEVYTAVKMSWGEFENGKLLQAAESSGFDKNLRTQQNLAGRRLAILELWTNIARRWSNTSRSFDRMPKRCNRVNIASFPSPVLDAEFLQSAL